MGHEETISQGLFYICVGLLDIVKRGDLEGPFLLQTKYF